MRSNYNERKEQMNKKRYLVIGLLILVLAVASVAAACGGDEDTTTTAAPSTDTTAPSTDTTAAPTETTAAPTETTAAGPATGEPIKVGLSTSLTGSSAAPGISLSQGVAAQVEYVNANGGINGRPIEIVEYDDASEVPNAIANINRMIQQDNVFMTIGPFAQYMQEPARQIAEETQVPMVGGGPATLEQLAGPQYQWSVMMSAGPPVQADALMKIFNENGWKNILGIGDVLAIHQETMDVLVEEGPANGFTFTKMQDTFGFDQTDFQPILNRMMEEIDKTQPDAILVYANMFGAAPIYKGLRALGVTVPIQGSPAAAHPALFSLGPEAVEGMLVLDSGGIVNPMALPDDYPLKALQVDFNDRYMAKYGQPADFFAAYGADLVSVAAEAMKQAGGADDRAAVAQALINLTDFVTLEGIQTYTPEATSMGITGQMVQFQVEGGQFTFVEVVN
jgi:branched-chain amino acid transport system substrate-binding protein